MLDPGLEVENAELDKYLLGISRGEKADFEEVYVAFSHSVYILAYSILHQHEEAEDVMQKVFIKIWTNISSYHLGTNPKAWIMSIARHETIDAFRKGKYETPVDVEDGNPPNTIITPMEEKVQDKVSIEEALFYLDEQERQIVAMRVLGGLTYLSISKVMSMPIPTIAWKYKRGIKRLYSKLHV